MMNMQYDEGMYDKKTGIKNFARIGTAYVFIILVIFWLLLYNFTGQYDEKHIIIHFLVGVILSILLFHFKNENRMSLWRYIWLANILYIIVSCDIAFHFRNIYALFMVMFFYMVAAVMYLDKRIFAVFQSSFVIQLAINIIYLAIKDGYDHDKLQLIIFMVLYLAIGGVLVSFISMVEDESIKTDEYEKSLDDMLKVIMIKCEEARSATKSKSAFLANMSHEIRTPINAVLGMNEMILRHSEEEETKKNAMDIKAAASSLLSLVNDILDISKIESGKMELVEGKYELATLINDVYNMSVVRLNDKDIFLDIYVDEELPSEYIGDEVRIKQILMNLMSNAINYTPSGTVILDVSGEIDDKGYAVLHFEVTDTGTGIKEEDMPKLFAKFERLELDKNKNIEGTGLGLNITAHLLKMMNSKMNIKSTYGYGSMFSFDLRQKVVNEEPIGDFRDTMHRVIDDYEYDVTFVAPDAHVLVVDDNAINRSVFCGLLKDTEIQITEADSGFKCLELVKQNYYDMIFMDHMMPGMDGVQTFQQLCVMDGNRCAGVPVVMLTANAVSGAKEMYLEKGFSDFLAKPVSPEKLESMVKKYIPKELFVKKKVTKDQMQEEETNENISVNATSADGLPEIEGIDWQYALIKIPDNDILLQTAKAFYESIDAEKEKIIEYIQLIDDEKYMDEYRIKVHSLKSTSAMIGAMTLSSISKILEFAAKDRNPDKIRAINPSLLEELDTFKQRLSVFDENSKQDKPLSDDMDTLAILVEFVKRYLEERDFVKCDATMEEILRFSYKDIIQEKIDILSRQVSNMDSDGGTVTSTQILDMI